MRTKIPILFLALFLTAPAFAQQPRIDSIAVDEDKGELVLHGSFALSFATIVLVDSVSLPIVNINDTILRATIPDSGKGSCGLVSVNVGANVSNKKLLTYIHLYVFHCYTFSNNARFDQSRNSDTIHLRGDFNNFRQTRSIISSRFSRCNDHSVSTYGLRYDSSGILKTSLTYDPTTKSFEYDISYQGYFSITDAIAKILLDNTFTPILENKGTNCGSSGIEGFTWGPIAPTDFPPSSTSVQESPSTPNILQTRLSSDPVIANAEVIVTLREAMNLRMEIMDILGHVVFSDERMLSAGENKMPINSTSLPSGIYICRLQAGGEVVSVRFVKE